MPIWDLGSGGISGRLARSENNLTRLAGTVAARHHLCEATKSQPQLLWDAWMPQETEVGFKRLRPSIQLALHDSPCRTQPFNAWASALGPRPSNPKPETPARLWDLKP